MSMRCLVTVGKHVNDIRAMAKQPPRTKIGGLLEAMFSFCPSRGYIVRIPGRLNTVKCSSWLVSERFQLSVEVWQLSRALQENLKRDGAVVIWQLTRVQLRDIRLTVRTWARKAEESALLEAVVRERLLKIQQAGKSLEGAVVICQLWRLAVPL
jgi:hypothetical protein